jgi:hypothetical protein
VWCPEPYKIANKKILQALKEGFYQHDVRRDIDIKNLLAIGQITAFEVSQLIALSDGTMHQETPLHTIKDLMVHVIRVKGWYIKYGKGFAENILVEVCDECNQVVSIPAQSTPAIAESRSRAL